MRLRGQSGQCNPVLIGDKSRDPSGACGGRSLEEREGSGASAQCSLQQQLKTRAGVKQPEEVPYM